MKGLWKRTLCAAVVATACAPWALAQTAPSQAPGVTSPGPGRSESDTVPRDWSIQPEVQQIESSMRDFATLSDSLGQASAELKADFNAYLDNPGSELLSSRLEKKMAIFADQVVQDFDRVIGEQDAIVSNFKDLRRKLGRFDGAIADKLDSYDRRLDDMRADSQESEQGLIRFAVKIKEAKDDAARKKLKQQFARAYRRHRLKDRYLRGLERNLHSYQVLVENLQTMTNLFTQLQDKFIALIENLENEKGYLLDAIELQQDSVKIKKIMHDGILNGERSIKVVTEQLAKLYLQVDAFTTVHEKINVGLGQYGQTQTMLRGLSDRIDKIAPVISGDDPAGIEDALEHFYQKRAELKPEPRKPNSHKAVSGTTR